MDDLLLELANQYRNRYFGKYRGFVADNQDPDRIGRLRLRVPSVLGDADSGWALPAVPFGGVKDQGLFLIPEIDAQVWVEFEAGNVNQPIWTGTFWQVSGDPPAEAAKTPPTTRLLKTPAGHVLRFDDESGKERFELVHPAGTTITIDEKGTVTITDPTSNTATFDAGNGRIVIEDGSGNTVTMAPAGTTIEDGNGNKVEMAAAGITLKAAKVVLDASQVMLAGQGGEPIIKGQSFLTLFATHVHPSAMGPTGPPIPQGEMSTLSMKTMTS
jgi:uncharacterized protein involved in type VI secretion and phage assembly